MSCYSPRRSSSRRNVWAQLSSGGARRSRLAITACCTRWSVRWTRRLPKTAILTGGFISPKAARMLNESIHFQDGELYCDTVRVADIAAQVGTPVYVYSLRRALGNLRRI